MKTMRPVMKTRDACALRALGRCRQQCGWGEGGQGALVHYDGSQGRGTEGVWWLGLEGEETECTAV